MNSLQPKDFARYRKEFEKAFGKQTGVFPETEFMFMLWIVWQDGVEPTDRFQAIMSEYPIKDVATLERAANQYLEMWNGTIGLLGELEALDDKRYSVRVNALIDAIKEGIGERALKQAAWNIASFTIQVFIERNRIEVRADTMEKQISQRVDQFFAPSDEPFSKTVMGSFAATVLAETADNSKYDGEHILKQLILLTNGLNIVRKGRLLVRQEMGAKGKNSACLCGSGLKHRDCCLFG